MTRPIRIPDSGSPIRPPGELHDILTALIPEPTPTPPPQAMTCIALFMLTGDFAADGSWYKAPGTRLNYYPATQTWNTPAGAGDTDTVAQTADIWRIPNYPPDVVSAEATGAWVWCIYDESSGRWVMLQSLTEAGGATTDRHWIGEPDDPGGIPYHKQPNTDGDNYADPTVTYSINRNICGLEIDDGGHIKGWLTEDGLGWHRPWGE
ncbi:MAG: hypothetical protein WCJ35_18430 [Planctomycetota bacterium]